MERIVTINDLLNKVNLLEDKYSIYKAYLLAFELHKGQLRESGSLYITHPLNVAYIIADLGGDRATIISSLLHDVLEDTNFTKEEILDMFGSEVASIVDGVTKIRKINYLTQEENDLENRRKLLKATIKDKRVIILKLADRLHNMRTLEFKSHEKQIETAQETMNFFLPFAKELGLTDISSELYTLASKYLKVDGSFNDSENKQLLWQDIMMGDDCSLIKSLKVLDIDNVYIPQHIKKLELVKG